MGSIERICKRNGTEDVLFYPYGIFGVQEEVVDCIHKLKREDKNISEPKQEVETKQEK